MSKEHAYAYEAGYRDGSIHYELEHCPACKNVADLQEALAENAKLRKLAARMAEALGIDCEWADPNWCKSPCVLEFGCWPIEEHVEIQCPAWAAMHELGIEVDEFADRMHELGVEVDE